MEPSNGGDWSKVGLCVGGCVVGVCMVAIEVLKGEIIDGRLGIGHDVVTRCKDVDGYYYYEID